jgi:hypothetical protein
MTTTIECLLTIVSLLHEKAAANAANNLAQNKKKEEPPPEQTPLEKMLLNAGPIRDDGTDKFFGLENVCCFPPQE